MKINTSRRLFLRKTVIATTGAVFLSSTNIVNAFTNESSPYKGYNPFAEEKNDLRLSSYLGKHVSVKGKVFDKSGTIPISNALIEVWHLSPNSKKFKHKAKLKTNKNGEYQFITDFPNNEEGKMPRIYFKISSNNDSYFTDIAITDFGAHISDIHWTKNNQLGDKMFPKHETYLNQTHIKFNLTI